MTVPAGYTELEYVQSTGQQYIDIGVRAKSGIVVEAVIETGSSVSGNQCIIGSIKNNGERYNVGVSDAKWEFQYGTQYGASSNTVARNTLYELKLQWVYNDGFLKVNETTVQTRTGQSGNATINMYLFARNNGGTVDRFSSIRVRSLVITDSGIIIRNLSPAKNALGTSGLYDSISGTFYADLSGNGFIPGPEVDVEYLAIVTEASLMPTLVETEESYVASAKVELKPVRFTGTEPAFEFPFENRYLDIFDLIVEEITYEILS